MHALNEQAQAARELIEQLRDAGRDDDEQLVNDMIEGSTDFKEIVRWALRKIDDALALEIGAKAAAEMATSRAKRFKARAERMRDALRDALQLAGLKKLELGEATVSLVPSGEAVHVVDETKIPAFLMRKVPATSVPDKAAIAREIKAGRDVPGCHLSNSRDTLAIRRA